MQIANRNNTKTFDQEVYNINMDWFKHKINTYLEQKQLITLTKYILEAIVICRKTIVQKVNNYARA